MKEGKAIKLERFTYKGKLYRDHNHYPDERRLSPYDAKEINLYLRDRSYIEVINNQGVIEFYFDIISCEAIK